MHENPISAAGLSVPRICNAIRYTPACANIQVHFTEWSFSATCTQMVQVSMEGERPYHHARTQVRYCNGCNGAEDGRQSHAATADTQRHLRFPARSHGPRMLAGAAVPCAHTRSDQCGRLLRAWPSWFKTRSCDAWAYNRRISTARSCYSAPQRCINLPTVRPSVRPTDARRLRRTKYDIAGD